MSLNMSDLNQVLMDVYLCDEQRTGQCLLAAASAQDAKACKMIIKEAKKRGVDAVRGLNKELERQNKLWHTLTSR